MKTLFLYCLYVVFRFVLWLRYRITIKGLDALEGALSKPGGTLFLANHPAEIDPIILLRVFWLRYRLHPVAVDYLFYQPIARFFLEKVGGVPVPNFESSTNSYKRREIEKTFQHLFSLLDKGENLLIYPAGGLKRQGEEVIGGASGVHHILQNRPNINVVLIRSKGLWGSSFSRALTGETPALVSTFKHGLRVLLKNFIFFTPRRSVVVECAAAPKDFPWKGERRELNQYLEQWYNEGGEEPLKLVSYSFWHRDLPQVKEKDIAETSTEGEIPEEIKTRVLEEVSRISKRPLPELTLSDHLATDLGLDSLDQAGLMLFLKETYGVIGLHATDLTDVQSVMAFAAKLRKGSKEEEELPAETAIWKLEEKRPKTFPPEGRTLMEAFLRSCDKMDGFLACTDLTSGMLSYRKLKLAALLMAEKIRAMPGAHIGIMMPASVGVNVLILATQLAGKIPVMINWTLGPRNLRAIVEQAELHTVLSAWSFLNRLESIDLDGIDEKIVLIEEVRRHVGLFDKLRALWRSRKKSASLLKTLRLKDVRPDDTAVILFTSGTESLPKGVPLSHRNVLCNQRDALSYVPMSNKDILLGVLPPFHSLGFSVTGIFPLLIGLRVAYLPNPTDGRRIAMGIKQWNVTFLCLAPSFLKNLFRVSTSEQLRSLRLVVSGAEKMPLDTYETLAEFNPQALLIEGYGITECAPILTLNPPDKKPVGVGQAIPSVHLMIVHPETLAPEPQGKEGLILARGPNIFQGYLDASLKSPFVQIEGKQWYETGDLGFFDAQGNLILTGRLKRFVKIGGEMVSMGAIEEVLLENAKKQGWPLAEDAPSLAVCAVEEEGKKGELHLFTIFPTTTKAVNQVLKGSGMSNLIRISSCHQVPFIPLLGTGKTDYRTLTNKLSHGNS